MLTSKTSNGPMNGRRIEDTIMDLLEEDPTNEGILLQKIQSHHAHDESHIYANLLKVLTSLDIPESEAKEIWNEVSANQTKLSNCLGREVGFRVALLDYFINHNQKIENPKIIEIRLFAETEKLILVDELTRLYNRRHFETALVREFKQASRYNQNLSLLVIDIDDFKKINDTYGHLMGDEILKQVAGKISTSLRMEDTACRIGGEEFAIIFPQSNEEQAMKAGEKLLQACRTIQISGKPVTISGGLVSYPDKAKRCEEMYDLADRALYSAKDSGKNQIVAFSNEKRSSLRFDANLELYCVLPDKTIRSISKNISITGIAFETEDDLNLNDSIPVVLKEVDSQHEINAKIKVVRKQKLSGKIFSVGAEFVELSSESQGKLSDLYLLHQFKAKAPIGVV
ncbi:diguanylate cyclase [Leptospira jelokensis]|uniref:diguanylate cyclase n=1 Tax=Leptospira jelokensis TaxID=2484931 RepID=UPI001090F5DD|nr:diguanylate cyclase [Leptospira jelokensis]TGM05210.1 diguanylate cyclase [Leptospira jelokensis]